MTPPATDTLCGAKSWMTHLIPKADTPGTAITKRLKAKAAVASRVDMLIMALLYLTDCIFSFTFHAFTSFSFLWQTIFLQKYIIYI